MGECSADATPLAVLAPGEVFISRSGQDSEWTSIGRTEGGFSWRPLPGFEIDRPLPIGRLADCTATVIVSMSDFWVSDRWRWLHDVDRACYPRRHRRCHVCHPKWSRPLPVDGREYRRRQLARQRRRRHGH